MRELLKKTRDELRNKMSDIRDSDIFVTPHQTFLPVGVKFPCIGVKDGRVTTKYLPGNGRDLTMLVRIFLFYSLTKREVGLVGSNTSGLDGILQLEARVIAELDSNTFGIVGIHEARVLTRGESQFLITKDKNIYQRKELVMQYSKTIE